jgi:DNA-binding FadR family transcriptional regulator
MTISPISGHRALPARDSVAAALKYLRRGLESNHWGAAACLPRVCQLARDASVSTSAMCSAIAELKSRGLLYACRGKGTFVGRPESYRPSRPTSLKWQEVRERLRQEVLEKALTPEPLLPRKSLLLQRYGIARQTLEKAAQSLVEDGIIEPCKRTYRIIASRRRTSGSSVLCISPGETAKRISIINQRHHEFLDALYRLGRGHNLTIVHKACPVSSPESVASYMSKNADRFIGTLIWSNGIDFAARDRIITQCLRQENPVAVMDEIGDYTPPLPLRAKRLLKVFEPAAALAGAEVGKLLLRLGHKKAAFVSSQPTTCWSKNRCNGLAESFAKKGYRDAVVALTVENENAEAPAPKKNMDPTYRKTMRHLLNAKRQLDAIPSDPIENILLNDLNGAVTSFMEYEKERQSYSPLFRRVIADRGITALVGVYDIIGLYALGYFPRSGISIPQDLSVVTFDDSFSCNRYDLTSYNFSFADITRRMLHYLLNPNDPAYWGKERIECTGIIMERGSHGPARAKGG